MSNMSYCRFENTLPDLRDCYEGWEEVSSESERRAQRGLLKLCIEIAKNYGGDAISNAIFAAEAEEKP